jgi:molecular chaperone GrpE
MQQYSDKLANSDVWQITCILQIVKSELCMFNKKKINIEDGMEQKANDSTINEDNLPAEEQGEDVKDILVDEENEKDSRREQSDAEKLAELNEKYLRLHADFDNFRRRTNKEKSELIQYGNKDLLLKILPVYDDFERAMDLMQKSENKEAVIDGIQLIYNKFSSVLQQSGLKEIEATGHDFDPELHEAITKIPVSPEMKGKNVDQVQKGYLLNDKIIRHSKVVVGE